jgi:hypothetical protein
MLMPQKIGSGSHYNFIFFVNHVLHKTGRTPGEPMGRTPSIFLFDFVFVFFVFFCFFFCGRQPFDIHVTYIIYIPGFFLGWELASALCGRKTPVPHDFLSCSRKKACIPNPRPPHSPLGPSFCL